VVPDVTLYVTDLDGTLLGSDRAVSAFSSRVIQGLIDEGVLITCATARSWVTAGRMLGDLRFRVPVILYNGTFTYDAQHDLLLDEHALPEPVVQLIIEACHENRMSPLLYWMDGTRERVSWVSSDSNETMDRFWADRPSDPRNSPRDTWARLPTRGVFNMAVIGAPVAMHSLAAEIRERVGDSCEVNVQGDTYHPQDAWLDIVPANVSKAAAVKKLASLLGANRLVVFGDNLNDLPMFAIADESYAVANAMAAVRDAATGVIGSNDEDGVARWLEGNAR
jgi:Cof subfamily protein (haloacid dehalogenase superfamily)